MKRTYHCHVCYATKKLDPKEWGRSKIASYCMCKPNTPSLMSPTSPQELDRKYGNIFKTMVG